MNVLTTIDPKAAVGATVVMGAAAQSWIETASPYVQFVVTVIGGLVGILTLYYTVLRVRKLRKELTDKERK